MLNKSLNLKLLMLKDKLYFYHKLYRIDINEKKE